jgi:hypothetical protein
VESVKLKLGSVAQGGDTFLMHPVRQPIAKKTRQSPRIEVFVPVLVCTPKEEIKGKMIDLSYTGAFILVPKLPDLTGPVQLFIDIPNSHAILAIAELVRFDIRPNKDGSSYHYGLGVHFTNISEEELFTLLGSLSGG